MKIGSPWQRLLAASLGAVVLGIGGCGGGGSSGTTAGSAGPAVESAEAELRPVKGSKASGEATVTAKPGSQIVDFQLRLTGLAPLDGCRRYAVWQAARGQLVPLGDFRVAHGKPMRIHFPLSELSASYLRGGTLPEVLVTKVIDDHWRNAQAKVVPPEPPPYTGTPVARGELEGKFEGLSAS